MLDQCDVSMLANEYSCLSTKTDADIEASLTFDHDWSKEAASEVVSMARSKGVFLFRNALALAIALGIDDGEQGF